MKEIMDDLSNKSVEVLLVSQVTLIALKVCRMVALKNVPRKKKKKIKKQFDNAENALKETIEALENVALFTAIAGECLSPKRTLTRIEIK